MRDTPVSQGLSALQPREDQADGTEHEIGPSTTRDAQHLLTIDGEIIAEHTEAEAERHHIQAQEPATQEEEAIPGELAGTSCLT